MVGTDILYESIFPSRGSPLCLKAQLVHPSDNKTTSIESWCGTSSRYSHIRVAGLLLAQRGWKPSTMPSPKGHREHTPAWRSLLLLHPQRRRKGRLTGDTRLLSKLRYRQRNKLLFFSFYFFLKHFYVSSTSSSVSVSHVLSMSKYGPRTHTRTHTSSLSVTLPPLFISLMLHCIICEIWRRWTLPCRWFGVMWRMMRWPSSPTHWHVSQFYRFYAYGWGFLLSHSHTHCLLSLSLYDDQVLWIWPCVTFWFIQACLIHIS